MEYNSSSADNNVQGDANGINNSSRENSSVFAQSDDNEYKTSEPVDEEIRKLTKLESKLSRILIYLVTLTNQINCTFIKIKETSGKVVQDSPSSVNPRGMGVAE
ncbi:unnamed protein product [Adineta steineri]|uniref:Uncharacterized protein n=1 Tax=Adineta steineri TaxID=433720 RepID=A0A819MLX9_9BILA|nr:unnamed protein product [Adineta steineri]CAF3981027.1 unnamed protein product [Adineta steineri]